MQSSAFVGHALGAVAARLTAFGDLSSDASSQRSLLGSVRAAYSSEGSALGADRWILLLASLLALFAVGGVAGRMASRLMRRSAPELIVLLDQSVAFYARWPEDRLADAPRGELIAEAARCRRIVELLARPVVAGVDQQPVDLGPIAGMQAWIALLAKRIDSSVSVSPGPAYA